MSGNGLVKPAVPFAPTEKILHFDLLETVAIEFLTPLTEDELTAPQRPLSEVMGTNVMAGSGTLPVIFLCMC